MEFNYLRERKRMFDSMGRKDSKCGGVDCNKCPFYWINTNDKKHGRNCVDFESNEWERATEIIREWSEKHPLKTRKEDLLERVPNARIKNGRPTACARELGYTTKCAGHSKDKCEICWNLTTEEV